MDLSSASGALASAASFPSFTAVVMAVSGSVVRSRWLRSALARRWTGSDCEKDVDVAAHNAANSAKILSISFVSSDRPWEHGYSAQNNHNRRYFFRTGDRGSSFAVFPCVIPNLCRNLSFLREPI